MQYLPLARLPRLFHLSSAHGKPWHSPSLGRTIMWALSADPWHRQWGHDCTQDPQMWLLTKLLKNKKNTSETREKISECSVHSVEVKKLSHWKKKVPKKKEVSVAGVHFCCARSTWNIDNMNADYSITFCQAPTMLVPFQFTISDYTNTTKQTENKQLIS